MKCRRLMPVALLLLLPLAATAADTLAITEFMVDPIGEAEGRQWVELFNYGSAEVDTQGWQISNNSDPSKERFTDLPSLKIPSGGFAVVVVGSNFLRESDKREMFEKEWLGGKQDNRVIAIKGYGVTFGRTGGEIILRTPKRVVAWHIGYKNDGKPGHATWFATDNFKLVKKFVVNKTPGVNRRGNDNGITGGEFLGFEGNDTTPDPEAYQSKIDGIAADWGERYNSIAPGTGSPLKGKYTTIK